MGILAWLSPPPRLDAATRALIDRTVSAIDPLWRSLPGLERKLAPAATRAFDYCQRLARAIPGPIPISRAAFATEPLVHALFASADDIDTMLARSQCVRTHLVHLDGLESGQCCALLGMRHREKTSLGAQMQGEVIRLDEPQKLLYFTDHTLAEPSRDLEAAHRHLAERMFDGLLKGFVAHVAEVRAERQLLSEEQAVARAFGAGDDAHTRRQSELQARLRDAADALQPVRLIETLTEYLSTPEASLRLEPVQLSVDRGGVIAAAPDPAAHVDTLRFVELTARDLRRWVVMIVRIDRDEARAAVARLDEARRHIVI